MSMQWFKLYGVEMMADPKFMRLSAAERSCWLTLLCLGSMGGGVIRNINEVYLMMQSGITPNTPEWNATKGVLLKLKSLKMINAMITNDNNQNVINDNDATVIIKNWSKRQSSAMTPYERLKKHRNRAKESDHDNEMITDDNAQNRDDNKRTLSRPSLESAGKPKRTRKKPEPVDPRPFVFEDELKRLEDNPRRDLQVLGFYFRERGVTFSNTQQLSAAIKRHIRDAVALQHFDDESISRAASLAEQEYPSKWTIGTLLKIVTK